jgi:hypothetical protein
MITELFLRHPVFRRSSSAPERSPRAKEIPAGAATPIEAIATNSTHVGNFLSGGDAGLRDRRRSAHREKQVLRVQAGQEDAITRLG